MGFLHKLAWLGVMLLAGLGQASAATTAKDDSQAAIALLEKALAYYHDNGDKAFAAFSRQGEFVDKDRYVFVVDTKGVMLASGGPSSALIGRDVSRSARAGSAESLQGRVEGAGGQWHPAGRIPLAELGRRQGRAQARVLPAHRPADSGGRLLPATGLGRSRPRPCSTKRRPIWARTRRAR